MELHALPGGAPETIGGIYYKTKTKTDIIVMDFSNVFDKEDHQKLLLKLHRFGIKKDVITWIGS